ncbi:MAG: methylenetetrahydrofolate--tRNA-(uracil(54)-C(5))-methyltransferase (FADH(2)-oxidizing) TrmFO [Clostridia bacterium]|nr:methylenetetrahydrofolate--tRNA-(uracil(54)-C(5))-methyltransferase (FADH(2)-oxidizing) TrmFO [Clostridia bacterium]
MNDKKPSVTVIGGGLAGCEAAWAIANAGILVDLYEMKPKKHSPAHTSNYLAELVCSNSLKARRIDSAAGLLKEEMRRLGSLCISAAEQAAVAAGGALAVDRDLFSGYITKAMEEHPNISVIHEEVTTIPKEGVVVVASGPLTSEALSEDIQRLCGKGLHFYDAAAPIVMADSIDKEHAFCASRYDKNAEENSQGDYVNCPMNKEEYEAFHAALVSAEIAPLHGFDKANPDVYEGCMPIEVLAKRGADSIRFGPMKPVGLRDPKTGHRPWAVLQLRAENNEKTMYNLVGFQTNLKFPEQKRVFGMIPALNHAEFVRFGVMHRNTFINSPAFLTAGYHFKLQDGLFFAGQMTGVEGYMESASSGLLAGLNAVRFLKGAVELHLPRTTMMGALAGFISDKNEDFQPMGANFGVLPPLEKSIRDKRERYGALSHRALADLEQFAVENGIQLVE